MSVVGVLSNECITELTEVESIVLVDVVTFEEKINFICSRENTNRSKSISQVSL